MHKKTYYLRLFSQNNNITINNHESNYPTNILPSQLILTLFILTEKIRAGEPEPGVFGSLEPDPEPAEKKPGAGAAPKKQEPDPQKICHSCTGS